MKLLKPSPEVGRNSVDMSHRHLFTANAGELLPVTCLETVPGDYIEFRISDLIRAIPMVTSPFMRMKQHFDVWFTPYEDLWSNFESFITQKMEPKHANNYGGYQYCPHVSLRSIVSADTTGITDVVGRDLSKGKGKIYDLLGYGYSAPMLSSDSPSVNLWRVAQYNKIWYEEYRQQYYDDGTRLLPGYTDSNYYCNPALLFNFDDLDCSTLSGADILNGLHYVQGSEPKDRLNAMFQMRYRTWKKDLFTGLMPATQFGSVSVVDLPSSVFKLKSARSEAALARGDVPAIYYPDSGQMAFNRDGSWVDNTLPLYDVSSRGFDVLALRKSEAIQIWRERALLAGNRISDNLRAHYGDDVDYNDHRSTFLGSVDAPLNISDVNSTAQTGDGSNQGLGDVVGKGISTLDDKVFKFKAKKFGCIMVLFSLLPETEYESTGIDRMNQLLESEDYFTPEYMNLGLEAVSTQDFFATPKADSRVIGYAPRYYAYKQKLDKAFLGFWTGNSFESWASPKIDVVQALSTPRTSLPLSLLYVNPKLFDRNFVVGVDNSDQFIIDAYFDCEMVRRMSLSGMPHA